MADLLTNSWYGFVLLGILAGILSGMLGVGSGALLIPMLVIIFAMPQKSAQGTALAVMIPMALVGAIRYQMNPEIDIDKLKILYISIGAVVGVIIGTQLVSMISGATLRKIFAVFLIIVAFKMLLTNPRKKQTKDEGKEKIENLTAANENNQQENKVL